MLHELRALLEHRAMPPNWTVSYLLSSQVKAEACDQSAYTRQVLKVSARIISLHLAAHTQESF